MKKKWFYLLAFFVPFGAMLGICIANGVYPFGKNSFMHCDMYHQYVPFLVSLWRKLHEGESLIQAWNLGLGTEYTAVFAYYLATPSNWLVYFCPEHLIIEFMTFMILIKIGLCGPACAYYLREKFGSDNPIILGFSTLYALSGFVAAYNWNHMWLDVVWLAPLVVLGLEKLVKERKCKFYCLTLMASIFTNYYLSVMLCIFLVFYFIVLLFTSGLKWKEKLLAVLNFGIYSLLGGGMTAVLLIPVMYAMQATKFDESTFPATWEFYFNGLEVLTRHFLSIPKEIGLEHWPNIYCGAAMFLLVPMYLFCGKIPLRQRIGKTLLATFMMLSFMTNVLNFLWHGFNYPNSLPARQSYLYILILLTMGCEVVLHIKEWKIGWFAVAAGIGTGILTVCAIFVDTEGFTAAVVAMTCCFFGIYVVSALIHRLFPKWRNVLVWVVLVLTVGESVYNMYETSVPVVKRSYYATKWENYENLLKMAKGNSFYRYQSLCYMTKNDGMLAGYPGISVFSSTTNSHMADLYNDMGMEGTKVSYYSEGTTALTSAMLGVKYTFSEKEEDEALYTLVGESGKMKLYENKYTLPVGYLADDELSAVMEEYVTIGMSNGLKMQGEMVNAMGITGNLFLYTDSGDNMEVKQDGHYYAYINGNPGDTIIMTSGEDSSVTREYDGLKKNCIIDLGRLSERETWNFTAEEDGELQEDTEVKAYIYRLNLPVLEAVLEKLGETPFNVIEYRDGYMSGAISVKEAGNLLLSIPADDGWKILVDGREVEWERWADSLITVPLSEGDHSVELIYEVRGIWNGLGVSLICLGLFLILASVEKKRLKRNA